MQNDALEGARQGDRSALNVLLERYKGLAYSIALKYTKVEADAEDIVQEAFVNVFLHIRDFRNESGFSTWLFKIVYFESLKLIRKRKPVEVLDEQSGLAADEQGDHSLVKKDRRTRLALAMQSLTANEYLIIYLYYLAEKDIREIGEITHQSNGNIKVILHRARKKMADYFNLHNLSKDLI